MKDEIKEILDDLRTYKDRYEYFLFNNLSFSDRDYKAKILLDHITNLQDTLKDREEYCYGLETQLTNLQEENKRLKENAEHNDKVVDKAKWNEMIYKSRNEKAIEYINKLSNEPNVFGHYGIDGNCKKYLLNILKGDEDE